MALILVVDDEPPIIQFLADLLEEEGHRVATADHGGAALDLVEREPPDLVISDLMMPVMDGSRMFRQLRENPTTAHIPVIMISAAGERQANATGADASFGKPIDVGRLLDAIETLLPRE
jgi:CheY-like chemotaxis protein